MRPRPKSHRRGQTLPGGMMSKEELERRRVELAERAQRILELLADKSPRQRAAPP
jgi:hypothetical protein